MNKQEILNNEDQRGSDNKILPQEYTPTSHSKKISVKIRWRTAFEKIKMQQLFRNDDEKSMNQKKKYSNRSSGKKPSNATHHKTNKINLFMLNTNVIAQKFASILKKQFKSLSAKQYTMLNDICHVDVAEDIKRRQKLKRKLEMNFLNVADKKTKKEMKRQFTHKLVSGVVGKNYNKNFEFILKPLRILAKVHMPDGVFRVAFDIFAMVLIVMELIQIPIFLSFQDIEPSDDLDRFSNFITAFFLTDLCLNFNTAFYERGHIVLNRKDIAKHYFKGWFFIDLLSSFPYDVTIDAFLVLFVDNQTDSNTKNLAQTTRLFRILQFIKFLRVLRLLRALKLKRIFGKMEEYLQLTPTLNAFLALIRLSFLIICIAHWCACGFHLVATFEESTYGTSWIRVLHLENEEWSTRYVTSIYWALTTMTTIGYGDVTPVTNPEKIYAMFMMILSSGVFGYTMNRIGNILQSFNETSLEYKIKLFQINQYMKRKNVPKELQARVRKYIEYTLDPDKTNQIDEKILFDNLSKNLQDEITVYINGNIIKQYDFLYKIFSAEILFKMSFFIHEFIYGPEEIILSENAIDDDHSIFFLTSGIVTVFSLNSNTFLNTLKEGSYFGEISFFANIKRTASVKSSDFISVFKLSRSDFWGIIIKENLREDREVFCQLKDKLELYKDHLLLNLMCYSCNCSGHVAKYCPEIHYLSKSEEIIRYQLELETKERKKFKRNTKKRSKNLIQLSYIQTSAYAIRNAMFIYHEEGVKETYRVETDMNEFLEENPKGIDTLSKKIINYKGANDFRLMMKNEKPTQKEIIDSEVKKIMKTKDEEEKYEKLLGFSKKQENIIQEYDELWNDFERVEIFNKYFIHNNFTIVKKKFKYEELCNKKIETKSPSLQNRIKLIKSKTIKLGKKTDFTEITEIEFKGMDLETPEIFKRDSSRSLNINGNIKKRFSSVDNEKECEKFIEKFGVENVYNISKEKLEKDLTKL